MRIYIWGTGDNASDYLKRNELNVDDIVGFIESKKTKESFCGKKVYEPNEIDDNFDYIFVCVNYYGREILNTCKALNIDTNKIIMADNWEWSDGSPMSTPFFNPCRKINENNVDVEKCFPELSQCIAKRDAEIKNYIVGKRNCYDFVEKNSPMLSKEFQGTEYQTDYFRYRSFELVANEIIRQNVKGNVAELGVFKGEFSKLINAKFNDRKLYLFDTFESFDKEEFQKEVEAGRCSEQFFEVFQKTNIDDVLAIMPYSEQCIVKKGLFPATTKGLENEEYAFVSIDVDFEKSILEGLRYFYPRLKKDGAIFIHDYNHISLRGARIAVDLYQKEIGHTICKIPIADWGGTLVVVK